MHVGSANFQGVLIFKTRASHLAPSEVGPWPNYRSWSISLGEGGGDILVSPFCLCLSSLVQKVAISRTINQYHTSRLRAPWEQRMAPLINPPKARNIAKQSPSFVPQYFYFASRRLKQSVWPAFNNVFMEYLAFFVVLLSRLPSGYCYRVALKNKGRWTAKPNGNTN